MAEKGSSGLWRRLRLYGFGFLIGLMVVYFMLQGRGGCNSLTPGMLKLNDLAHHTKFKYNDTAICQMKCQKIDTAELMEAFTYGKVATEKSQSFGVAHPLYNFTGQTRKGKNLNVICMEFDSVTRIIYVHDLAKKDTCKCP